MDDVSGDSCRLLSKEMFGGWVLNELADSGQAPSRDAKRRCRLPGSGSLLLLLRQCKWMQRCFFPKRDLAQQATDGQAGRIVIQSENQIMRE